MLIYADHKKNFNTSEYLREIQELLKKVIESRLKDHSINTELLIRFGEFESSIVDLLYPEHDSIDQITEKLRAAAVLTGHIFIYSLLSNSKKNDHFALGRAFQLQNILKEISEFNLPDSIIISLPEGYAYYGLYPEMYFEAAEKFIRTRKPEKLIVLGIRSIGTSLSAVVSACAEYNFIREMRSLKDTRYSVDSITLRPRGDYFSRQVKISDQLKEKLNSDSRTYYLVIDEGPGLSGTSLCSVAEYLSCMGISDEKIVIFPSWEPDANSFVSELSRKRWLMHEKFTSDFEEALILNGRLKSSLPYSTFYDISAGKWRGLFYDDDKSSPAVYQNFEQRKYILIEGPSAYFVKFAGLGHYGKRLFDRAQKLYEGGFSPKAYDMAYGFIRYDFLKGKPLQVNEVNHQILERFASYLAFIGKYFPAEPSVSLEDIKEMVRINVEKGIGSEWKDRLSFVEYHLPESFEKHSVAIDGRMLPHEWLITENGLIKTDSVHHHSGHLLPGALDIAWDIAGTIIEFHLKGDLKEYFLNSYIEYSNDRDISKRLNLYQIAYLSFRLGYSKFADERLGESSDGAKFRDLSRYYSSMLKDMLH